MMENVQSTPLLSSTQVSNHRDTPHIRNQDVETANGLMIGDVARGFAHIMNEGNAGTDDRISESTRHLVYQLVSLQSQRQSLEWRHANIDNSVMCCCTRITEKGRIKIYAALAITTFILWVGIVVRDVYYPLNGGNLPR